MPDMAQTNMSQTKFLFETSFDGAEGEGLIDLPGQEPPPPQFEEADLERARAEGFEAGRQAAQDEIEAKVLRQLEATEYAIDRALGSLLEQRRSLEQRLTKEAIEATVLMLKKLYPALAARGSLAEVEALIGDCLGRVRDEPRIVVRVAAEQLDAVKTRIEALAAGCAYEGKVVIIAEDGLRPGDALVEWADGGAKRDAGRLMQEMETAIGRAEVLFGDQGTTPRSEVDEPAEILTEETPDG